MDETVKLNVGNLDDMGKRFVDAWHRLEKGEELKETNLTFFDWSDMVSTLSPKKLELLRYLHAHPEKSVSSLAKALSRDYKRVHEDVASLEHAGLVLREDNLIKAPYQSVQASIQLG